MNTCLALLIVIWTVGCGPDTPPTLEDYRGPAVVGQVPVQDDPPPQEPPPVPRQALGKPLVGVYRSEPYVQELNGPEPREILHTNAMPSEADIVREVATHFAKPSLLRATPQPPDDGLTVWTLAYDGIALQTDARTAQSGSSFTTRWIPAERGPDLRRADLIGADRARAATGARTKPNETRLFFEPVFGLRRLPRGTGDNTMDYVRVIASYRVLYEVPLIDDTSVHVDAYTGDLIRHFGGDEATHSCFGP